MLLLWIAAIRARTARHSLGHLMNEKTAGGRKRKMKGRRMGRMKMQIQEEYLWKRCYPACASCWADAAAAA